LAVYRYQHGMDFTMQLLMEVRRFYHPEYLIGKIFARPDEKELESFFPPRR
jgi:transcriptional antiterminator